MSDEKTRKFVPEDAPASTTLKDRLPGAADTEAPTITNFKVIIADEPKEAETLTHFGPPASKESETLTHAPPPASQESATLTHAPTAASNERPTMTHAPGAASREAHTRTGTEAAERQAITLPEGAAGFPGMATAEDLGDWKSGDVIDGKYEVREKLGHGGMGVVYRVHHRRWRIDLAVKLPTRRLVDHPQARQRFLREAETWVGLGVHPNIVQCWYVRELGGIPRLFLDYVPGGNLKQAMRAGDPAPGQWSRMIDLMVQACDGLAHAHAQGMVHRDVKPANMLITADGMLKVTDFGLVRQMSETEELAPDAERPRTPRGATQVGSGLGTAEYGAPEQWVDASRADHRADIYAIGMTLYEMAAGRRAFDDGRHEEPAAAIIARHMTQPAPDPRTFRPDIPEPLVRIILKCLEKNPAARPDNVRELRTQLVRVHEQVTGQPLDRPEPRAVDLRAEALNNRAVSLYDLGKQDQAMTAWNEALKLDPAQLEAFFNRSLLEWRKGHINAEFLLARLEEAKQQHRWAGVYAGYFHLERLALEEATRDLAEALGHEDIASDAAPWRALGHALLARESPQDATEAYTEALARAPLDEQSTLGKALAETGLYALSGGKFFPHPRVLWTGHEPGTVRGLALAGNGDLLVAATRERTGASRVLIWQHRLDAPVGALDVRAGLEAVALVPDGRRILSGSADGTLQLWNLEWGNCRRAFREPGQPVTHAALSADGAYAVTSGNDARARLWDLRVTDLPGTRHAALLEGHAEAPRCLVALPTRPLVAIGGADGRIALYDLTPGWWRASTLEPVKWLTGHQGAVTALAASPDGQRLASGGADGTVRLWSPDGVLEHTFTELKAEVAALAWAPDAARLVAGAIDRTRVTLHVREGRAERVVEGVECHRGLVLLPGDILVGHDGRRIVAIDLNFDHEMLRAPLMCSRAREHSEEASHHGRFRDLLEQARQAEAQGNRRLAMAFLGAARSVPGFERDPDVLELSNRLSRMVPRRSLIGCWLRRTVGTHPKPVLTIAVAPDSEGVLTGCADERVRWFRGDADAPLQAFGTPGAQPLAMAVLPGGSAVVLSTDGAARLIELGSGRVARTWPKLGAFSAAAFTPDAQALIGALTTGELFSLTLAGGARQSVYAGPLRCVTASADGQSVYAGSGNRILAWRPGDAAPRAFEVAHTADVLALIVTPDGSQVISCSADCTVRSWHAATGELNQIFLGHDGPVASLALTPDGRFVFSGGQDGVIHLWDIGQAISQRQFPEGSGRVNALAITPDGRFLYSAAQQLKVWELDWEFQSQA